MTLRAVVSALIANAVALAWALHSGFRAIDLLAVYWAQSVAFGVFHSIRICLLREFYVAGERGSGDWSTGDAATRGWETASVRAAQYRAAGLFMSIWITLHVVALLLVGVSLARDMNGLLMSQGDQWPILGVFLLQQAFVLVLDVQRDRQRAPNVVLLRQLPFARLAPLLLVLYIGALAGEGVALLWILAITKTAGDSIVQLIESRTMRPAASPA